MAPVIGSAATVSVSPEVARFGAAKERKAGLEAGIAAFNRRGRRALTACPRVALSPRRDLELAVLSPSLRAAPAASAMALVERTAAIAASRMPYPIPLTVSLT